MIIQGDNHPSIILMDTDLTDYPVLSVGLYNMAGICLKHWDRSQLTVLPTPEGCSIACPWTQADTAALPAGSCIWLIKAQDPDGLIHFWERILDQIGERDDREVVL